MSRAQWYEYPLDRRGELADAYARTLIPVGVGAAMTFAICLAIGLPTEEGMLWDVLYDAGFREHAGAISAAIDLLTRATVGVLLVLTVPLLIGGAVASAAADSATSRALVSAARAGAPRHQVPAPAQVRRVARGKPALIGLLFILAGVFGFFGLFVVIFALIEDFPDGLVIGLLICVGAAGLLLWGMRTLRRTVPRLRAERLEIAAHWRTEDEEAAWESARDVATPASSDRNARSALVRAGRRIEAFGYGSLVLAVPVLYAAIYLMYPNARRGDTGPRASLDGPAQLWASVGTWAFSALVATMIVAQLLATLLRAFGERSERALLRRLRDDPVADRPDELLLAHHAERHVAPWARVAAGVGGAVGILASSTLFLSGFESGGYYQRATELFGPLRDEAAIALAVAVALVAFAFLRNAQVGWRERELRNALRERWPSLPEPKTQKETKDGKERTVPIPATVGPALTPPAPEPPSS